MMAHAIDTPAPTTIILISGDRDFVYAVSILALRQYRVVVLTPKSAHNSLKAQADTVYQWPDDFLADPSRSIDGTPPGPDTNLSRKLSKSAPSALNDTGKALTPQGDATMSNASHLLPPPTYSPRASIRDALGTGEHDSPWKQGGGRGVQQERSPSGRHQINTENSTTSDVRSSSVSAPQFFKGAMLI